MAELDSATRSMQTRAPITAHRFRDVLSHYGSGVTVVTSLTDDGQPVGMTCQAFSNVSLNPPLVMFVAAETSHTLQQIRHSGHFAVNFLAADQADLAARMAMNDRDKFANLTWTPTATGAPHIDAVVGYVDCTVHDIHDAGDHQIVVGHVRETDAVAGTSAPPLLYQQGRYGTFTF
ncbi:flavin reductase family protein [Nonomuraea sp. NPDC059023]|uniref:flavin reductase family protein n=1 Tax=unclassified Nonomuraea TaxID=2593643 RepID=UPI00368E07D9